MSQSSEKSDVTFRDISEAAMRIKPFVHRTPVLYSSSLAAMTPHDTICFKCENFQLSGSFKIRGATNAVACELERHPSQKATFVTHSSGNHGQALALAAKRRGCTGIVVVPKTAPNVKVAAMKAYGAKIVFCEPTQEARMRTSAELVEKHVGSVFVHPYDHPDVIAGQGTLGIELMEQTSDKPLDAIVVPVGGGGLSSGVAIAVKHMNPNIAVFGAEPINADDTFRSLQQGSRVAAHRAGLPNSIADGLLTLNSDRTFGLLKANLEGVLCVSEAEIQRAMYLVYERCKLVIEPSAAVGVAAVLGCPAALASYKTCGHCVVWR